MYNIDVLNFLLMLPGVISIAPEYGSMKSIELHIELPCSSFLPCLQSPNSFKLHQLQSGLMRRSTCCMSLQAHLRTCCECVCFKKQVNWEPKLNQTKQILLHEPSVYPNIFLLVESYCKLSSLSLAYKISVTIRQPPQPPLTRPFQNASCQWCCHLSSLSSCCLWSHW